MSVSFLYLQIDVINSLFLRRAQTESIANHLNNSFVVNARNHHWRKPMYCRLVSFAYWWSDLTLLKHDRRTVECHFNFGCARYTTISIRISFHDPSVDRQKWFKVEKQKKYKKTSLWLFWHPSYDIPPKM